MLNKLKEGDLVLYTGLHLKRGIYRITGLVRTHIYNPRYDRFRISTIKPDKNGFYAGYQVYAIEIKTATKAAKLLYNVEI